LKGRREESGQLYNIVVKGTGEREEQVAKRKGV
jgi:hypothetical protein